LTRFLQRTEEWIGSLALGLMVLLPLLEIPLRLFDTGVPGSVNLVRHLTLWVCFVGAAMAARRGKLLAIATGQLLPAGRFRDIAHVFSSATAAGVATLLCRAGIELAMFEREAGTTVTVGLPAWVAQLVLPMSFAAIAVRLCWRAGPGWKARGLAGLGIVVGLLLGQFHVWFDGKPVWPLLVLVLVGTALGGPIFALLGGAGALLFMADGIPPVSMLVETYELTVHPTLAAIPLFALVGFLLAVGNASHRLLRVFRALFGAVPGGTAVVCAMICAFFTVFTGGSGVTILALGGLLFQALREDSYRERFSLGMLTASGSLGLLFPPAMPLILYGIVAHIPIEDLFLGGILPGVLLVAMLAAWGVREGIVTGAARTRFEWAEARAAIWAAKWELLLPVIALAAIFSGYATIVEAAALTVLYAFVVQVYVHRDLRWRKGQVAQVFRECLVLVGGVLLILGVAKGFSDWLVHAEVTGQAVDWVQAHIHSPLLFLLCLNVLLLLVGCVMDIFSAIVVVVPLLVPLGAAFGIHPVHLGIIFVANLELGYLTPPVGLNLFLASYRFDRPLLAVYRAAVPMLAILGVGVLLITYVPPLTTGLLTLLGR
jgi:tripartite ATP-independent transporter DctM subunit